MDSKELALKIKQHCMQMTHDAKSAHIGSCLSCADILAVLYNDVIKQGDKFILGKGHACAALYATLAECGYFPIEDLKGFYQDGSFLQGHANHYVKGVEVSTGSLGQGLAIGCGMALATKNKVYVLIGDGDLNEGQTWEAVMFAGYHKLDNLIVIVDYNGLQALGKTEDILDMSPIWEKFQTFGWYTHSISGDYVEQIYAVLQFGIQYNRYKPTCIIADTVKGKGIKSLENKTESHYHVLTDEELKLA